MPETSRGNDVGPTWRVIARRGEVKRREIGTMSVAAGAFAPIMISVCLRARAAPSAMAWAVNLIDKAAHHAIRGNRHQLANVGAYVPRAEVVRKK